MRFRSSEVQPDIDLGALRRREVDAVEAWFETFADAIYSFVYYRVGRDPELAADVAQDTFVNALERIEQFDPSRGELFPWLTYIARNCVRKARRRQADPNGNFWEQLDTRIGSSLAAIAEEPLPPDLLEREETRELVRLAMSNLSLAYQRALVQRYFEQLSVREIAAAQETTQGAVKVLLYRARLALRAAFVAIVETLDSKKGRAEETGP